MTQILHRVAYLTETTHPQFRVVRLVFFGTCIFLLFLRIVAVRVVDQLGAFRQEISESCLPVVSRDLESATANEPPKTTLIYVCIKLLQYL